MFLKNFSHSNLDGVSLENPAMLLVGRFPVLYGLLLDDNNSLIISQLALECDDNRSNLFGGRQKTCRSSTFRHILLH